MLANLPIFLDIEAVRFTCLNVTYMISFQNNHKQLKGSKSEGHYGGKQT